MPTRTEIIDALHINLTGLNDQSVNGTNDPVYTFTFQFDDTEPSGSPATGTFSGWTAWTEAQREAVRDALAHVETFINVEFVEVTGDDDPDIDFGRVTLPGNTTGFGGPAWSWDGGGNLVSYDGYAVYDNTIDIASGEENLILHEIGHVLGLAHPFEGTTLPDPFENNRYTVMSYTENPDNGLRSDALQIYDILALQARWGANDDYQSGNSVYSGSRTGTVDAIWDAGGRDLFDASSRDSRVILDLREGRFSSFDATNDVAIAYDTVIENARGGGGNDKIIGNNAKNKLFGNDGNDKIVAKGGRDVLNGGAGNDRLDGDTGNDRLIGGVGRDTLIGDKGNDVLTGGGGADKFIFKNNHGQDTIRDFADDVDLLRLHINGVETVADAMDFASNRNGHVVFEFANGLELTVRNITKAELRDDIDIF